MTSRRGMTFVLVLIGVLAVAGIAMTVGEAAVQRRQAAESGLARAQARAAALGILRACVADLAAAATAAAPILRALRAEGEPLAGCSVVLVGRDPSGLAQRFGLIPQAGRIDLNLVNAEVLAALPGITPEIAAAIIDWRDSDDEPLPLGAERSDGHYAGATVAYAPRNGPFQHLDELRLVRGVDDALFFGEDRNANGRLDAGEDGDGDGRLTPGLRDLLTIESREPLLAPDGTPRTLVHDQSQPVGVQLEAMRRRLRQLFAPERARALMDAMHAEHDQHRIRNRLHLFFALGASDEEAQRLWPYLIDQNGRLGLVDAESAPDDVLAGLIGAAWARTIANARPDRPGLGPNWVAKALGREGCLEVGGRLTVGSYQFIADLLAVRDDGAGWVRFEARLDASLGVVRVAGLRPAEALGWPLATTPAMLRALGGGGDPLTLLTTPAP